MKNKLLLFLSLAIILGITSCKKDDTPTLGDAPTETDAAFTFAPSTANVNIIDFTATNAGFTYKWDFGNGLTSAEKITSSAYPAAGTYKVTLTVFNSGGSASSSQDVVISEDDPTLLSSPLFTFLTGGIAGGGSKTWVIDSTRSGHIGVGPIEGTWPEWWEAPAGDKGGTGLYSDKYTFKLDGFKFNQETSGLVYIKTGSEGTFTDAYGNKGDFSAPFPDQLDESWTIAEGEEDTTLSISGKAFIGMYTGVNEYKIVKLSENELTVSYIDVNDATTAWYIRLVPEDFPVDGGGEVTKYSLPFDFESPSEWNVFGNSTYEIKANPQISGINTSANVLETVHGNETWAGLYVNLDKTLDFSGADSMIAVKIFAPQIGTMRIKIENSSNTDDFEERDVEVTTANSWVEVKVGFSSAAINSYDRLVLFPGWDTANAGTFLLDDVKQTIK